MGGCARADGSRQEVEIGCLAHHHDFYWERDRFVVSAVDDLLQYAFPPALPQIQHVVINSPQGEEFSRRTGLSCRIIPNIMDFANPPAPPDAYAGQFRSAVGLNEGDLFVLQPTRVVARVEHNYQVAKEFFSYEVLEAELRFMIERPQNLYRLLKRGRGRRARKFASAARRNL